MLFYNFSCFVILLLVDEFVLGSLLHPHLQYNLGAARSDSGRCLGKFYLKPFRKVAQILVCDATLFASRLQLEGQNFRRFYVVVFLSESAAREPVD